jgi:hypothetical protein
MPFDWSKLGDGNVDFNDIPQDIRLKMRAAWDRKPADDPLDAILRMNAKDDDPFTRDDARKLFDEAEKKAALRFELENQKRSLGLDFDKYLPAAQPLLDKGYSPSDAFTIARHADVVAAATEEARKEALKGVQAGKRADEQVARGNGAAPPAAGASGNKFVDDPELYKKTRTEIGAPKYGFDNAVDFRVRNPDFVAAEKHFGDLKTVPRR